MIKDYRMLCEEASFTTAINRGKIPPWGAMGGGDGTTNYVLILRDGKELMRVNRITNFQLKKNDVVSIRSGGGGGWGDPRERDHARVKGDVLNGYITADEARRVYGVS